MLAVQRAVQIAPGDTRTVQRVEALLVEQIPIHRHSLVYTLCIHTASPYLAGRLCRCWSSGVVGLFEAEVEPNAAAAPVGVHEADGFLVKAPRRQPSGPVVIRR